MADTQAQGRAQQGKRPNYFIGVRRGLLDAKHREAMGSAVWTFMWAIDRQTDHAGTVAGGEVLNYATIASESGAPSAAAARQDVRKLAAAGYLRVENVPGVGLHVWVANPKRQYRDTPVPQTGVTSDPGSTDRGTPVPQTGVGGVPRFHRPGTPVPQTTPPVPQTGVTSDPTALVADLRGALAREKQEEKQEEESRETDAPPPAHAREENPDRNSNLVAVGSDERAGVPDRSGRAPRPVLPAPLDPQPILDAIAGDGAEKLVQTWVRDWWHGADLPRLREVLEAWDPREGRRLLLRTVGIARDRRRERRAFGARHALEELHAALVDRADRPAPAKRPSAAPEPTGYPSEEAFFQATRWVHVERKPEEQAPALTWLAQSYGLDRAELVALHAAAPEFIRRARDGPLAQRGPGALFLRAVGDLIRAQHPHAPLPYFSTSILEAEARALRLGGAEGLEAST